MQVSEQKLEAFRVICRSHAFPTGRWECLKDLPLRLSRDASMRAEFVAATKLYQQNHFDLPDVLELLTIAVGGADVVQHTHQLSEQLNLLGGFLASVGRWPDIDASPILAPGEIPANLQKFTRPQSPVRNSSGNAETPSSRSTDAARAVDTPQSHENSISSPSLIQTTRAEDEVAATPSQRSTPDAEGEPNRAEFHAISDISRALARLERGNLELRAHLDSIDQRISRMEPLLELSTPPPSPVRAGIDHVLQEPPLRPLAPEHDEEVAWGSSARSERLSTAPLHARPLQTEPIVPEPMHADELHVGALRSEPLRGSLAAEAEAPQSGTAEAARRSNPAPAVPRFSRFLREDDSIDLPSPFPSEDGTSRPREPARSSVADPVNLPKGFFGIPTEADEAEHAELMLIRKRQRTRRRFAMVATILVLLALAGAGFFYIRRIEAEANAAAATITPGPAPRATGVGPLTSTPTQLADSGQSPIGSGRVMGARDSFRARQSAQDLGPHGAFRPAGTFVPAQVMEGRLLSAPMPDKSRLSPGTKGPVVLEVNVSNDGRVEDINVLGGARTLQNPAIEAVRMWRYKPYLFNGVPIEVRTIVRVDFQDHVPQQAVRSAPFPP